jgi:hypothetical protein
VHISDNLRTLTGSAGQSTHTPVDVHIDPFCTLVVTETRQQSVARAYLRGLNFECPREAGIQHFDLSLSDLDAPKPPLQNCAQKTSKCPPLIFEFWPAKLDIRPSVRRYPHSYSLLLRSYALCLIITVLFTLSLNETVILTAQTMIRANNEIAPRAVESSAETQ